jgi:cell division protein FtsI/penicillin-binding protein 2
MLFRQTSSKKQLVPKKKKIDEKVFRYWLVEFTLTSGEILQFYVNGLTQFDAYEKADGYKYWIANEKLKNKLKTFRLMP